MPRKRESAVLRHNPSAMSPGGSLGDGDRPRDNIEVLLSCPYANLFQKTLIPGTQTSYSALPWPVAIAYRAIALTVCVHTVHFSRAKARSEAPSIEKSRGEVLSGEDILGERRTAFQGGKDKNSRYFLRK
jgi:hypothetical protein